MAAKLDVNKQNIMHAINWIIKNEEEIIFESQSLIEAKEIYNKQKIS